MPRTPVFQLSSDMMIFNFIFSDYTELYRMKAFFWKNLYDEFGDLKIGDQKYFSSLHEHDMNIVHKPFFEMLLRSYMSVNVISAHLAYIRK